MDKENTDSKYILIIEDDDFLRSLAVSKLQKENFEVGIAANGREGLARLEERTPDLLLLDLMLPEVDGFGILQSMKDSGQASQMISN